MFRETAITITGGLGDRVAIHHSSEGDSEVGVLIVVGGPQFRVGSHRQFVSTARFLAENNIEVLRFDFSGMGDSTGEEQDFRARGNQINEAISVFRQRTNRRLKIFLYGLCDGASSIALAINELDYVSGAILLNPWVHEETVNAEVFIKNYYGRRLLSKNFWRKFVSGKVNLYRSIHDFFAKLRLSLVPNNRRDENIESFVIRTFRNLKNAEVPIYVVLSENDFTAREFETQSKRVDMDFSTFRHLTVSRVNGADHTFSNHAHLYELNNNILRWIETKAE